ncbi:deSI-like protein At4g17486 [Wolffia australiana]
MFIKGLLISCRRKTGSVPVYLNVYDLTPINGYAYWFGLGIYHSGVQVHGVEYAYGAHDHPSTGIFSGEPRQCPGFRFRKSILIGRTDLGPREVRSLMAKMAESYSGSSYHLITKNCNHFCNDVCLRLVGRTIPRWVNRLANIGLLCNCVLPVGLHVAGVRQRPPPPPPPHDAGGRKSSCHVENKKIHARSVTYMVSPSSSSSCSSSPVDDRRRRSRQHQPYPAVWKV